MKIETKLSNNHFLFDILTTLLRHKFIFLLIIILSVLPSIFYPQNTSIIYQGEVLFEIGEIILNSDPDNDKPTIIEPLEKSNDLIEIIQTKAFEYHIKNKFTVESPRNSDKLLKLSLEGKNKEQLSQELKKIVDFIIKRHETKAHFFKQANGIVRPSLQVGNITILPKPVSFDRTIFLSISLFIGLLLGILIAFGIDFIQNYRHYQTT